MRPRWRRILADLRALLVPILTYAGTLAVSIGLFCVLVVSIDGFTADNLWILVGLVFATVVGVGFGQICALTRIRTWIVFTLGALVYAFVFIGLAGTAYSGLDLLALPLGFLFVLFPFFAVSGLLSLRTSVLQVFALFAPMLFVTASVLLIAQDLTGSAERWFAGDKWAVWDVLTAPILLLGVALSIGYLVSRERHRLYRWSTASLAPQDAFVRRLRGSVLGATASGCGTLLVMSLLIVVLTFGTGVLSPYLWRTGEGDRDGSPRGAPTEQPAPAAPQPAEPEEAEPEEPSEDPAFPTETLREVMKDAGLSLFFLVLMVLLCLLGLLVFGPPLRRSAALAWLRSPPVPTPPSERVGNAWRLCEIALADLGVERSAGDTASALALRAAPKLPPGLNLEPLLETADIADRVRYGLGLDPHDEMRSRRNAEMAYQGIWQALGEWEKVRAIYRWSL